MHRRDFLKGLVAGAIIAAMPVGMFALTQPPTSARTSSRIVIAASNSSASTKRAADVVVDGHNDARIIRNAIDQMSARGGVVYMNDGTFYL